MFEALLFDFDGVIVDTEVPTYEAWRDTYAEFGVELTLAEWLPAVGTGSSVSSTFDAVAHLETLIGRSVDREEVIAFRSRRKAELYERAQLLPGVRERLAEARSLGLKTSIVTRNREDRVRAQCARVELDHRWDELVCANENPTMDKAKLYSRAVTLLGTTAASALAFEDSPAGLLAAKAAGIRCIAVPNEVTRLAAFDEADVVVASLGDHSLNDIIRLVLAGRARRTT